MREERKSEIWEKKERVKYVRERERSREREAFISKIEEEH